MQENKNMLELAEKAFRMMVEPFISHPENLEVRTFMDNENMVIEPTAHFSDMGKIIGKGKENFKAVELILQMIGWKHRTPMRLYNLPPAKVGRMEFRPPFDKDPNWDNRETYELFKETVKKFLSGTVKFKVMEDDENTCLIFLTDEELPKASGEIARALSKIFHAIGKARGRLIYVTDNIEEAKARLNETAAKS